MQGRSDPGHLEGRDTHPGQPVPLLDGQARRDQGLDDGRIVCPVHERQELPVLEVDGKPHESIGNASAHAALRVIQNLYKLYDSFMLSVTLSEFRKKQSEYIAAVQREPVEITSRGANRRAVVVSPEFFDRAIQALEDQEDLRAAHEARNDSGATVSHEELSQELGL